MSQRAKRPNRSDDGSVPVKRRKRTAAEEEEAASLAAAAWQPRSNDLKSIYNRTTTEAPAELFRKDLISAMKLPDSEPLALHEYWVIVDQWKQEWERGVQVPVNPDSLPEPSVTVTHCTPVKHHTEFKLPKTKYIRITKDDNFKPEEHQLSSAPAQSEAACSYDLDECDIAWLKIMNAERAMCGQNPIHEDHLERVIEQFELSCWDKIQSILRNEEGLGIEYDENVICDVCRSPDSEEGNEMVFCDSCNICVHQACYGITRIPEGQWLCCTCNLGKRPKCVLCPNKGGAMKSTRSGQKWAHVSCALWIPEVSIGCVEKMEPITKISSIPQSRWALICVLCRERVGACIQCSVKTCKTAYHVTCAFKHGLEMRAIIEDENADDGVKLRSYCEKHSKSSKKEKSVCSGSEDDDSKRKKRKDMTSEEKNQARAARLQEIEAEFFKHVSIKDVSLHLNVDNDSLHYIYNYWKLKRKAGSNKPLLPPKSEDVDMLSQKREQADLEKMKMFVQLRQDLERVRNLCYMVSRREKLSRSFFRLREQTFHKQTAVLESAGNLPNLVFQAVCEANHGPSIYDRLYSHDSVEEHKDFDTILARIAGSGDSSDEKKPEINGLLNPYKKVYFNGTSKRRSGSLYGSSSTASAASSSDEKPKLNRLHPSSTDDEKPALTSKKKIKNRKANNNNNNKSSAIEAQRRRKRHSSSALSKIESTSDEEEKTKNTKKWAGYSKSRLKQVERELGYSASDSDELIPIHHHSGTQKIETKMSSIYSDSDSSDASIKNTDSQQNKLRTKAAVKEFSHKPSTSKQNLENKKKTKVEPINSTITSPSKKEPSTKPKKDYVPSDLIVPQRQAAKKATENLKSTTTSRAIKESTASVEEPPLSAITSSQPNKLDDKLKKEKLKTKLSKETPSIGTTIKRDGKREREEIKRERDDINREREATKREKEEVRKEKEDAKKEREDGKEKSGTGDVFDIEKEMDKLENQEILAYVPQRQAAKKAAEHIKSGLGKAPPSIVIEPSVEVEKPKSKEVKKEVEPRTRRKSSSQSSSSSSTSSSSYSSSSSSSESDDEPSSPPPPTASAPKSQATAATATAQQKTVAPPRSESREQSSTKRTNAQDWPFLDKVTKPTASSSSESSSDSSRSPSPIKSATAKQQTLIAAATTLTSKSPDKKQQSTPTSSSSQREESARYLQRGKGRHTTGRGRLSRSSSKSGGDVDVRTRNLSDSQRSDVERERNVGKSTISRKGKSDEVVEKKREKSPAKLLSPIRKADKKLNELKDVVQTNLEKEILERKAGKQGGIAAKTKSTLDRLFGNSDKKIDKLNNKIKPIKNEKVKSTVKENKEPLVVEKVSSTSTKKSPVKTNKNIDEIFAERIISTNENKVEVKDKQNKQLYELEEMVLNVSKPDEISVIEDPKITEDKLLDLDTISEKVCKNQENNRSIFSPTHLKDNLLDDFDDNLDGFGISKEEEIMKGPLTFTFGNSAIFKEDSKEDSARETLNLVEKLRMELSKKSTSCDVDDSVSVSSSTKNDNIEFAEQVVPPSVASTMVTDPPLILQPEIIEQPTEHSSPPLPPKDFHYCDADVTLLEQNKNIPIEEHHTHGISSQGDERWVPPSDSYLNLEASNYSSNDQHYHLQQYASNHQTHHNNSKDVTLGKVPPSPPLSRISQTPLNETGSMDCMPDCIQSPYSDVHPQAKWADSEIMPNRRSSSSSAASTSSSCSRRNDDDDILVKRQDVMMVNHPVLDNLSYLPQALPFAPESFPPFSESSQFAPPPVSLFPPPSSLAFTSTAPAMFPPAFGAPFPTPHSVISSLPKTVTETVPYSNVAFTASQHNLALTAAMVNLPKELEEQQQQQQQQQQEEEQQHQQLPVSIVEPPPPPPQPPSPIIPNNSINQLSSPSPSVKSNNSSVGKKSPSKPTRSSTRVINKSPGKSPAPPPLQESINKNVGRSRDARKNSIKATANAGRGGQTQMRGRGRGRGRGRPPPLQHNDYDLIGANTIHNKLVGTVYDLDFDDENSNDNMTDLKSMRERRKSTDLHDRKNDTIIKDTLDSPKNRSYNADLRDLRPPTPIEELAKIDGEISGKPIFSDIVAPVLPGPVDMRTYSGSFEQQPYTERNLLQAFATGTTETQVHEEIDEDFEKELQTALTPVAKKVDEPVTPELANIKVSLSDARNQLKVKIKGPIANYSSTIAPLPPPVVDPVQASIVSNNSIISNNSVSSGTTNLRRMRKKELLRQYWTQDMNMDDNSSCATPGFNTTAPTVPHVNRTIITIPKAVASMTSIPTKEDYRDYRTAEDTIEPPPKIAKTKSRPGALSRELKQLDLALDENGGILERRRSSIDASKRRGRPPRPSVTAPKIKIKIGNSVVGGPSGTPKVVIDRIRPPKKRLHNLSNKPSVEDLKRESMKFRKLVMADFGGIKEKRKKKDKSEKRKRKKAKAAEMQIITNEGQNSTKLIIRIGKKSSDSEKDKVVNVEKATPIKLKLARCQEGSGYVMKQSPGTETKEEESVQPGQPPPTPPAHSPPPSVCVPEPPPLKKDCEVR